MRVGVVGAGIVGASIAYHLAEAGAQVSIFERTGVAAGATRNSFAWVNAFVDDLHYRDLRLKEPAGLPRPGSAPGAPNRLGRLPELGG